jgi:2-polyprenyl-3-methyl-5-hydroxy-6-metoxy-1,4-benzoquinol methylase
MKKSVQWSIAQKVELRWWQSYLKDKSKEAYHLWKKNYWLGILDKVKDCFNLESGSKVLDAGCGPAGMYMVLEDFKVDAIDPLLGNYQEKIDQFDKADYPYVEFTNCALEDFQPKDTYDIIFCMNAINHVNDINRCYDLLDSWLKPGGILVMTIDAHNYAVFKYLFRIIPGDLMHPYQYSLEDYNQFLITRDYKVEVIHQLKSEFFFNHYLQVARKGR